ncbi:hypothetical protein ACI01nite_23180 [Acetobacter cibinongensis]|uniref:Transposase n=2 Tax=Acetobacter cibinongensis TaxID=146475 RepID=A0A0D6N748_9PROT|nr:transposase [Acetobacter cibinongensis]GBQ15641.1 transposase [Acetobacter cibinongensis NRIC 0482]GEL59716.1 hypothetical protein ACI01nite_23180 [Acetobacter cibinongensis]
MGTRAAIPEKRWDGSVACLKRAYRYRHLIENLLALLREWRAVAIRYEKTAKSFLAAIHVAVAVDCPQALTGPSVTQLINVSFIATPSPFSALFH